ncbi:hypothetical protein AB0M39_39485 [Streptomyces sp. NPDC051907]|uniref:hypothetical protein n=1 Tax=Streptomyces sp. NPDC051907 TaxID=3155284 RepID=UPI003423A5E8
MTSWQRKLGSMRAHWKLALSPLGFSAVLYGNSLYESSHQRLGLVFFLGGWVIAIGGVSAWQRFIDENPLRGGYEKIALLGFFLLFFLVGPVLTVAKAVGRIAQPGDYRAAAASMGLIYLALPLIVRWAEPEDHPFQRLPSRIRRATFFRTLANAAGIGAVAAFLSARFVVAYPALLISTALTQAPLEGDGLTSGDLVLAEDLEEVEVAEFATVVARLR